MDDTRPMSELEPCPNPWCVLSDNLPPALCWHAPLAVAVECGSCGMQGPSFSPVVMSDDGEQIGTRDAEAEAIAAWNTRPSPPAEPCALAGELRDAAVGRLKDLAASSLAIPANVRLHPREAQAILAALRANTRSASGDGLVGELERLPSFYDNDRNQYLGITLDQHDRILSALRWRGDGLVERAWGPWIGWDGSDERGPLIDPCDFEQIVEVERRGPDAEHWMIAEAHHIDWKHTGGKEDVLRFRVRLSALSPHAETISALVEALEWYGEQARLARLIHSEGDAGRHALARDGGNRARTTIPTTGADHG